MPMPRTSHSRVQFQLGLNQASGMAMDRKEEKKEVLKRLLALVAVANESPITPTNILKAMRVATEKYGGRLAAVVSNDRISTYLGKTTGGKKETNFPRSHEDERQYLLGINLALFGAEKLQYFKSFEDQLSSHSIWRLHGTAVEDYLCQSTRLQHINTVLVAPDYLPDGIDPEQIETAIRLTVGRPEKALDAHFLYQSPRAASLWESVKNNGSYGDHYRLCQAGLRDLLCNEDFRGHLVGASVVLNLGVGAIPKDHMILSSMQSLGMNSAVYCWVDASYPMLHRTLRGLDPAIGADILKVALLANFENPLRIARTFDTSFGSMRDYSGRKIFFVLGFTLSNLREENFFAAYSKHCEEGDVLVFPMQFIPDKCRGDNRAINERALTEFKEELLKLYNFKDGWKLARAGLSISEDFEPTENALEPEVQRCMFFGKPDSLRLYFQAELVGAEKNVGATRITTAESFRHFEDDYFLFLEANGFRKICESKIRRNVRTIAVMRVKKESK